MRYFVGTVIIFLTITVRVSFAYEKEIKNIAAAVAGDVAKSGKKTIAVADFTDLQGNVTELGRFIAEELSGDLTGAGGFEVIDRSHLKNILAEHKLSMSGLVDPKTVKKLGEISGVDAILTGSVTPFGDSIRVATKVIATDTARVISASKGDIAKTKAIEELLGKAIETSQSLVLQDAAKVTSSVQTKAITRLESGPFVFELRGCKMTAQEVKCTFSVTNNENRVSWSFLVPANQYLYDDFDNQFVSYKTVLGGKTSEGSNTSAELIPNVPENGQIFFNKVTKEARVITLGIVLQVGYKEQKVVFRNVLLNR